MGTREVDSQRSKVYKAEDASKVRGQQFASMDEVTAYVRDLCRDPKFKAYAPRVAAATYEFHNGGGARRATCTTWGIGAGRMGRPYVRLMFPKWSRYEEVVLHEMAHAVSDERHGHSAAAHGRGFTESLLWLVRLRMGAAAEASLKAAFTEGKVKFRPKREMTPAQLEAARRGLAAMAARTNTDSTETKEI